MHNSWSLMVHVLEDTLIFAQKKRNPCNWLHITSLQGVMRPCNEVRVSGPPVPLDIPAYQPIQEPGQLVSS